jgi:hypothetical protein
VRLVVGVQPQQRHEWLLLTDLQFRDVIQGGKDVKREHPRSMLLDHTHVG